MTCSGVGWQARCVTNTAYYAKLQDPGDGSFLRISLDSKSVFDPTPHRPTFGGAVKFGSGTVLDIADVEPYTPVVLPSLAGVPTIRNGAVRVASSTWMLREGDLTGGVPLTIEASASLAFPSGAVTVTAEGDDLAFLVNTVTSVSYPILTAADDAAFPSGTFQLPDALKRARWHLKREGNTLYLDHILGLTVILR